jgi:hypothetical protein
MKMPIFSEMYFSFVRNAVVDYLRLFIDVRHGIFSHEIRRALDLIGFSEDLLNIDKHKVQGLM